MSNDQVIERIQELEVDILVDCDGHFRRGSRLPVFKAHPALLQVALSHYTCTTGLQEIDIRISDNRLEPPPCEALHAERLVRVPHFFTFEPQHDGQPVSELPGLDGPVTFASFSQPPKINDMVIACWAEILHRVPRSRLMLQHEMGLGASVNPALRRRIEGAFADHGIEADRLLLCGRAPHNEFVSNYSHVDIALDTFPYNGTLTILYALYMGVPVVTLRGNTGAGRAGAALLEAIGLHAWIATCRNTYIDTAVEAAADRQRLQQLRRDLRSLLKSSPIMDVRQNTADIEDALDQAWRNCLA
jgi:predicted O-linked N-acetylglucosamine transferase (SPINDLY family)